MGKGNCLDLKFKTFQISFIRIFKSATVFLFIFFQVFHKIEAMSYTKLADIRFNVFIKKVSFDFYFMKNSQ